MRAVYDTALGARYPAKLKTVGGVAVATFSDKSLILKKGSRMAVAGIAKAKWTGLNICFIGSVKIPVC